MTGDSNEIATAALGLLTATHADSRMAGPVTRDYLAGVPTDRSQMLDLIAGMAALATMLIQMRAEETGAAPEDTLAELGRRVQADSPIPLLNLKEINRATPWTPDRASVGDSESRFLGLVVTRD